MFTLSRFGPCEHLYLLPCKRIFIAKEFRYVWKVKCGSFMYYITKGWVTCSYKSLMYRYSHIGLNGVSLCCASLCGVFLQNLPLSVKSFSNLFYLLILRTYFVILLLHKFAFLPPFFAYFCCGYVSFRLFRRVPTQRFVLMRLSLNHPVKFPLLNP